MTPLVLFSLIYTSLVPFQSWLISRKTNVGVALETFALFTTKPETSFSAEREGRLETQTRGWLELHANFSQLFAPQDNAEILPSPHVGNGGEVWPRPLFAPIGSLKEGSESLLAAAEFEQPSITARCPAHRDSTHLRRSGCETAQPPLSVELKGIKEKQGRAGIPAALQDELLVTKAGCSKGNELSGVTQAALLHKPLHRCPNKQAAILYCARRWCFNRATEYALKEAVARNCFCSARGKECWEQLSRERTTSSSRSVT
ncbi:hypothetical protein MHYP_G00266920 [Metynnis hypsauchen]